MIIARLLLVLSPIPKFLHHHHHKEIIVQQVYFGSFFTCQKKALQDEEGFDENFDLPVLRRGAGHFVLRHRGHIVD